ncbi:MAG: capsular biosynthesis protein [Phenylobacterium sp.]|uniref:hypothetical protein n=1 Tax=Phenylobacterium sp. TaxID=1871053 RepID=UPI00183CD6AC|nr:hypothetical protein [Phenylobacterium sp.]MBA4793719.1 capsular biosynthesis protein [Phenylobacterium sp.]
MTPVRLIMSGAAVGQELAAEFGPLPPSLLPVGVQRLYELQVAALEGAGPLHMVLPESYVLSDYDRGRLAGLGVTVVEAPEGLTLGEAVVYALNSIGAGDVPVHILHGDTLIEGAPVAQSDVFVSGARTNEYAWAEVVLDEDGAIARLETTSAGQAGGEGRAIAAGYFAFSSSLDLLRALTRMRGDFIAGLNHYVAERPVRLAPAKVWLDFGHLQTFFQSKLAVTTARAFNTVRIDGQTARKSSADEAKIWAEAHWLQEIPPAVQIHCARLLGFGAQDGRVFYETEYEFLPVLSELFVFGAVARRPWLRIMASCEAFLAACAAEEGRGAADDALLALAGDKTRERLEAYARATGFPIDRPLRYGGQPCPSLLEIAERLVPAYGLGGGRRECVMHGDFCFSNILYDSRVRRIKAIDPRGLVGARSTIYGDSRYDLAKLAHSIVGRYDQIIAGRCRTSVVGDDFQIEFEPLAAQAWLEAALGDLQVGGVSGGSSEVRAVMTSLFLSMPPLHADRPERQQAFIANALRLFRELDA